MMGTFGCPLCLRLDIPGSGMSFDFSHAVSAPFRMQPGLRRLAAGSLQLTPNRPDSRHLLAKLQVLRADAAGALLQTPGFDPSPALAALAAQAQAEHPAAFHAGQDGIWHARWLGVAVDGAGQVMATSSPPADPGLPPPTAQASPGPLPQAPEDAAGGPPAAASSAAAIATCLSALPPPWRQPALLALAFAEDFAIVDGQNATLPWLAVALPSRWAPVDKVGRHFAEVHAPVADNRLLLAAGDHLMRLVTGPDRWERFVWNITRHAGLDTHPHRQPDTPWPAPATPDETAGRAFFRTERQTFIPVPAAGQAVFTILVDSRPLTQALREPAQAAALHQALATMSPAVLAYRSLAPVREPLLAWLARRAATPAE